MSLEKQLNVSGKEYYRALYQTDLESEAEWLTRSATNKVDSIEQLLLRNQIKPAGLLELGSGPGAVIKECQRRGLGSRFAAIDYSLEAIAYIKAHCTGIEAIQADITDKDFTSHEAFDVVVLSHVLEHLEDPEGFLRAMVKSLSFRYVILEVPLEDLAAARVKNLFRDRRINEAGHVQFFTAGSFERMVERNGLRIIDRRTYVPVLDRATIEFVVAKNWSSNRRMYFAKALLARRLAILLRPLWAKYYYAHHAVLCVAAP
jgi:SAM-dependent methyltransferase